jgi:hypothetical protein
MKRKRIASSEDESEYSDESSSSEFEPSEASIESEASESEFEGAGDSDSMADVSVVDENDDTFDVKGKKKKGKKPESSLKKSPASRR